MGGKEKKKKITEGKRGLLLVYTGEGKGKTTAALGLALRAVGQGMRVSVVQFLKGSWPYGERTACARLAPDLEILPMGEGFLCEHSDLDRARRLAERAWKTALGKIRSGSYGVVVLDEIHLAIHYGLLDRAEVVRSLTSRPPDVHIVCTGRYAPREILDAADMVSEVREIRHHYRSGRRAERGVEY